MDIRIKNLFLAVEDPRIDRTKKHPLDSILYIVWLCCLYKILDVGLLSEMVF